MSWQIIHDDDVAATEGWCEALLDVREEDGAVHRSINHEGSDNPVVAQAGDESDCFPMSMRNRCDQPLPARATTPEPHHVCAGSGLVDKHQPSGVKHALLSYPTSASASNIGSFLLCRVQAFLRNGSWRCRSEGVEREAKDLRAPMQVVNHPRAVSGLVE